MKNILYTTLDWTIGGFLFIAVYTLVYFPIWLVGKAREIKKEIEITLDITESHYHQ